MKKIFKTIILAILSVALIAGTIYGYLTFFESDPPVISLSPDDAVLSSQTSFSLHVLDKKTGLASVQVSVRQKDRNTIILSQTLEGKPHEWSTTFTLENATLKDGPFELLVTCTDTSLWHLGKGNTREFKQQRIMDTQPPVIDVISRQHNIAVGGCGAIVYTLSEPAITSGVMVGERFFPGFKQQDTDYYLCLFAFPYDAHPDHDVPQVIAKDKAGNTGTSGFNYHIIPKRFRKDTIRISDGFLKRKMPQFTNMFPQESKLVDVFLKVNNQSRTKNRASLKQFARQTSPQMLWDKAFIRQPGAATRATFGDKRTYTYSGKVIDHQRHLGIDLASVARDRVKACNVGTVVFQGFMGIYGNVVIIDHGMGLQSLYAHLSQILVHEGDTIKRGQIIGKTGATGLAGGDHLHLGIILAGLPVSPVEWWDGHWITNNITSKLHLISQASSNNVEESLQ